MTRRRSYWNNIPREVVAPETEPEERKDILRSWGFRPWGRDFPGLGDYEGWQRVRLPDGWTLSLEGHNFYMLDQYDQIRGTIRHALPRFCGESTLQKAFNDEFGKPEPPAGPKLILHRCINLKYSVSLGETGPHSLWVENAFGEQLFGFFRVDLPPKEAGQRLEGMRAELITEAERQYSDWQSYHAHWETFLPGRSPEEVT